MPKNIIPQSVSRQLRNKLSVDFTRYSRMRPRKLSLDGADVRFLLSLPPKNSKIVMQADFLVANVTLDTKAKGSGYFSKKSSAFENGTKVTYQFKSWSEVETFIDRLPHQLPLNKVTILKARIFYGCCVSFEGTDAVEIFFNHLDGKDVEYSCSHQSVSGMKHLRDEMFAYGYNF